MKNTTYSLLMFLVFTLLSCNVEKLENNEIATDLKSQDNIESTYKKAKADFVVTQSDQGV